MRRRRFRRRAPVILDRTFGDPTSPAGTAVLLCGPWFDQRVPSAGVTWRLGMARGFAQAGASARLMGLAEVERLDALDAPLVLVSESDFEFLSDAAVRALSRHRLAVWVNPWFEGAERFCREHRLEGLLVSPGVRRRVLRARPELVFAPVPPRALAYYQGWARAGVRPISLPLACDTGVYDRVPGPAAFPDARLAFVGGYWAYKARSFDRYLRPWERDLTVFGYSPWPYAGFGGQLAAGDEPRLYRDALLCPAVCEPHACFTGDIPERVFKVLGSGGLCVADVVPGYRELFAGDELLMPGSVEEFHETVRAVLADPARFAPYREAGYRAVRARHSYRHRAALLAREMGLTLPGAAGEAPAIPGGAGWPG